MAKFKLRPPKVPKRPKVVNPMKGVNRARTLFLTSLLGFTAFLMSFVFIYKSITKEGSQLNKKFNKAKARHSASAPAKAGDHSDLAPPEVPSSGSTLQTDGTTQNVNPAPADAAADRSDARSSRSIAATPVPIVANSPIITPTFEDPVCFWGKRGIARSHPRDNEARKDALKDKALALKYLRKAVHDYTTEFSDDACVSNAQTFLANLENKR